jgi:hypothetical protein
VRACHAAVRGAPLELPPLRSLFDEATEILDFGALHADDRAWVRRQLEAVEIEDDGQPLHADAGLGNVLPGAIWNDWEDGCIGPVGWDLACLVTSPRVHGGVLRERAEAALAAYGAPAPEHLVTARALQVAAWSALSVAHGTTTPERLARRLAWLRARTGKD